MDDVKNKERESQQDKLIEEIADLVLCFMEERGITKADIARKLGKSRSHITQVTTGDRNMTLRNVSDLCWAVGADLKISLSPSNNT